MARYKVMALKVTYADGRKGEIENPGDQLEVYRHSTSHLMAAAVSELYSGTHLGIGPAISDGFYYDFERGESFVEEDLKKIEQKMKELIVRNLVYEPSLVDKQEAVDYFAARGEHLKVELIEEKAGETLSCYRLGDLVDFCTGPHLISTGEIDPATFRLLSVAGSYWRGDEKREQLQRIYGTSWFTPKDLEAYLHRIEEAKRRDHRKLGPELDLFGMREEAGGGLVFYYPKGSVLRNVLIDFWKQEHLRHGYELVDTPHISKADLWHTSGHMSFYRENMYIFEIEGQEYVVKPMNCPGHILIYKRKLWSYRELPVRYGEMGTVYRYERSGTLHGMLRVRGFTQDDAHIFCTPAQLEDEVVGVLQLVRHILQSCGFSEFAVELSVRDPENKQKYAGTDEEWERAEASLVKAIAHEGLSYVRKEGEAVFYGPKIDVKLVDALGRKWQTSTVQFDFNLPRRFDVQFVDHDGERRQSTWSIEPSTGRWSASSAC